MKSKTPGILNHAFGLLIDHFISFFASIVIINLLGLISERGIPKLQFILCIAVYFTACYSDSWHRGSADKNRIALGAVRKDILRGLYAGLVASIPGFVLALLAFLAETDILRLFDTFGVDVLTTLNRVWQLPVASLYTYVNRAPILNFAIPFIMPLFAEFGYIMGMKNITLKSIFVYKGESEEE